jgi:hypothetical protein
VSSELIEIATSRAIAGATVTSGLRRGCRLLTRRGECEKKAGALECVVPH